MRSKRRYLIAVSLTVHLAVVLALFVVGFWRIDRLDPPRHRFEVAVQGPPAPAPEGGLDRKTEKFKQKQKDDKKKVNVIVQPDEKPPEKTPTVDKPGDGSGSGSGSGSGIGSGSSTSKGECIGECGEDETVKPKIEQRVIKQPDKFVPPQVLKQIRIFGKTQIHLPDVEKTALLRSGKNEAMAKVSLCVGETGNVTKLSLIQPSGYAGWDTAILAAVRAWRHKPYMVDGRAITICTVVTFNYRMK